VFAARGVEGGSEVLRKRGVTAPRKLSPTTGQPTYAFAKTDQGMTALLVHPDPEVRMICEARVLWKSTLEESRLARFQNISTVTDYLPVALLYYGAHTGRLSGLDSINLQNLTRPEKGKIGLRHALVAPPGHKVVTVDLSQIEARIVATLAGQWDLIRAFANGDDIYSLFASDAYGYPCDKKNNPVERFVGKTCILGLGYGMGAERLLATLIQAAAKYKIPLTVTLEDCERWVKLYRSKYQAIPKLWRQMGKLLKQMCEPNSLNIWKMLTLEHGKCKLPNNMYLHYPHIQLSTDGRIVYEGFRANNKVPMLIDIWGGTLLENISQALAQLIIKRAELRLARHNFFAALQVHDELVYVVPDELVERVKKILQLVVLDPIPWMKDLPLACEVGVGQSYGDAK
jgi:DNA polymerase